MVRIWENCGFGNYLIKEKAILEKFLVLHGKYRTICRSKNLALKPNTSQKHKEKNLQLLDSLFDISSTKFEELMRSDKSLPRDQATILEDLEFLEDQR